MPTLRTPPARVSASSAGAGTGTFDEFAPGLLTPAGAPLVERRRAARSSRAGALEQLLLRERPLPPRTLARTARGRGIVACGTFECAAALATHTELGVFAREGRRTAVTVRFGSAAGERSLADTVRDARCFAVRFHTEAGPWDLLNSSVPVAPLVDAAALAGLPVLTRTHGAPAASQDAFWDFVARRGEALHHALWLMSGAGLPRSWRTMPGYGIDTWRLSGGDGAPVYARLHWVPLAGALALQWDEAARIAAVDPEFHRRDFCDAIDAGELPEYELALQIVDTATAARLPFDVCDPTKLIPEDVAPLRTAGRLVLERYRDDPLADDEVPPFESTRLVPGIEAAPPVPLARGGHHDPYAQPRRFWRTLGAAAQRQLGETLRLELARVGGAGVRERVLARLAHVDFELAAQLADALNVELPAVPPPPERGSATPALALHERASVRGVRSRRVALLVCEGCDLQPLRELRAALEAAGALPRFVGLRQGVVRGADGRAVEAEASIGAAPSVLWDAAVLPGGAAACALWHNGPALEFVREQYRHGKPLALLGNAEMALTAAYVPTVLRDGTPDAGLVIAAAGEAIAGFAERFIVALLRHRHLERLAETPIA